MKLHERDDYRNSFFDGMCANIFGTLTGGVFLTGFALYLGMSEWMIGFMVAIPYMVTLFQLPGAYYTSRRCGRKKMAAWGAAIARLLWLPILAVALFMPDGDQGRVILVLGLYFTSQAFGSMSYVSWLAWTSELVPDEIRGKFFGTRNMLCGAAGIAAILIFGNLVDVLKSHSESSALALATPFFCAVLFGVASVHFMNRVPKAAAPIGCTGNLLPELVKPLRKGNFRNFLLFVLVWNFSVYVSAPFFALYFLSELNYSYGFIALLTTFGSLADLVGMKFWGAVSDRVKNRAVIQVAGWGVVVLPSLWILVRPEDVLLPLFMQTIGGGLWAGVSLCIHNMNLRISPQESRIWFISAYNITAGLGAAVAPVIAGCFLSAMSDRAPGPPGILPLHYLFIASSAMRVVSMLLLNRVREPQQSNAGELLSLFFRSIRPAIAKSAPIHPSTSVTSVTTPSE